MLEPAQVSTDRPAVLAVCPGRSASGGALGAEQGAPAPDARPAMLDSRSTAISMIRMTMIIEVAPAKCTGGQPSPVSSKAIPVTAGNFCRHRCSWARLASLA